MLSSPIRSRDDPIARCATSAMPPRPQRNPPDTSFDNLRDVPEVRLVEADLRDAAAVMSAASGCTAIFHQGAKRSVLRSMIDPVVVADVNVSGTLHVLLAAREHGAVVVSASS